MNPSYDAFLFSAGALIVFWLVILAKYPMREDE